MNAIDSSRGPGRGMRAVLLALVSLASIVGSQALAQGAWSTAAPLPVPLHSLHAASVDGLLYVVGGNDGVIGATNTLEIYDPAADAWSPGAPLPGRVYDGTMGVIDGKLYLVGGWNYPDSGLPTRKLQIYDPSTDSWSYGADFPTWYGGGCSASGVIGRKLYVLTACLGYNGYFRDFLAYDPDSNTWASLHQPPNVHAGPAHGVIGGRFYVAGGSDGTGPSTRLDVYDPATDTWASGAAMPTARSSLASAVIDGKLYAAGGYDGSSALDTVEVYDPSTDSWAAEAPMPAARWALAGAAIDGRLYAVGGYDGSGPVDAVEVYTPLGCDPAGLYTQEEVDRLVAEAVAEAEAAKDLIIAQRDQTISDLLAEMQQKDLEIGGLTAQVADLAGQVADLEAAVADRDEAIAELVAALAQTEARLAEADASLAAAEQAIASLAQSLQSAFADPQFIIPGESVEARITRLVSAIESLNHGQRQALYVNLGGKQGKSNKP